jgi:hypothetical protein
MCAIEKAGGKEGVVIVDADFTSIACRESSRLPSSSERQRRGPDRHRSSRFVFRCTAGWLAGWLAG